MQRKWCKQNYACTEFYYSFILDTKMYAIVKGKALDVYTTIDKRMSYLT